MNIKEIIEAVSNLNDDADLATVVRQVYEQLDNSFLIESPTIKQQKVLNDLLSIADRVELFTKER